jgi:hypothetical protein
MQVPPPPVTPPSQISQPAPPAAPAPAPPSASAPAAAPAVERVFASDAGIIFSAIKPAAAKDFETVLGRLRQALAASPDPTRRQQATGWKIFKAAEPGPNGSVLYVFVMDPAVKGADYGVAKILAEAYPAEAQQLYRLYIGAFASGQTLLNLEPR